MPEMSEIRSIRLRRWMTDYDVTYRWIGDQLGISDVGVRALLLHETMPTERHRQCVQLGIPVDLLPTPLDLPSGRRPKVPKLPGLMAAR